MIVPKLERQAARWTDVETAERDDTWALAKGEMHRAGPKLSEFRALHRRQTMPTRPLHLAVQDKQPGLCQV